MGSIRGAVLGVLLALSGCHWSSEPATFTIAQTYKDGHPLFLLIDTRFRDVDARLGLPWFVSVATRIEHPVKDGLTNEIEGPQLNAWEDDLEKAFAGECRFVYVGHVTWNGTRELLYYVDKPDSIVPKLEKLGADGSGRAFRVQSARDDVWEKVGPYLQLIRE